MLENFIYAKLKSLFEEKLNNGEVLDEAIVFIEDTKEIWNHGTYFDGNTFNSTDIEASISELKLNYFKWSKLTLFSFALGGVSYNFEEGMTWEEWILSDYYNSDVNLILNAGKNENLLDLIQEVIGENHGLLTGTGMAYNPLIRTLDIIIPNLNYIPYDSGL